ncbi:MAG: hypothetical protein IKR48_12485 [Kiritimatiellae bacterium]|nr:hypothetical protein [Kiritimatiellia bacterium]
MGKPPVSPVLPVSPVHPGVSRVGCRVSLATVDCDRMQSNRMDTLIETVGS